MNWTLLGANFKMVMRNKQALYFSLVFPVITMLVLKLVLGKTTLSNGMNYIDFVIPGLIAMSVLQSAIFGVAFVLAQQKEKGVIKRLLATPMSGGSYLSAEVLARVTVSIAQVLILASMAILFLGFTLKGSFLSLTVLAAIGSLVFLSLGFIVSGLSKSVESVPAIANLVVFPMIIFGNIFFSIDNAPNWLKPFADRLPIRYLVDGLREVMVSGASLYDIKADILWLVVWLVVFFAIAQRVFSFNTKR